MHLYKYLERAQVMNAKILWQGWVEVEEDMKMCPAGGWTSEIVADFGVVEWMMNNEVDEEECHVIESGEWPERGRNALNRSSGEDVNVDECEKARWQTIYEGWMISCANLSKDTQARSSGSVDFLL